jgi:hypothetical protein
LLLVNLLKPKLFNFFLNPHTLFSWKNMHKFYIDLACIYFLAVFAHLTQCPELLLI